MVSYESLLRQDSRCCLIERGAGQVEGGMVCRSGILLRKACKSFRQSKDCAEVQRRLAVSCVFA